MSERKFLWSCFLGGNSGNFWIGTGITVYHPAWDGENAETFTSEEVDALNKIRKETPEPKFSENIFEASNQMKEYAKLIREIFNKKQNTLGNEKQTDPCAGQTD